MARQALQAAHMERLRGAVCRKFANFRLTEGREAAERLARLLELQALPTSLSPVRLGQGRGRPLCLARRCAARRRRLQRCWRAGAARGTATGGVGRGARERQVLEASQFLTQIESFEIFFGELE